jgi:hypothetical protein
MNGSGFSDKVHMILKENGKGFGIEFKNKKLIASEDKPIDQGNYTWLEWADYNHRNFFVESASVWNL